MVTIAQMYLILHISQIFMCLILALVTLLKRVTEYLIAVQVMIFVMIKNLFSKFKMLDDEMSVVVKDVLFLFKGKVEVKLHFG